MVMQFYHMLFESTSLNKPSLSFVCQIGPVLESSDLLSLMGRISQSLKYSKTVVTPEIIELEVWKFAHFNS